MSEKAAKITDAELRLMQVLWSAGQPLTAAQLKAALPEHNQDTTKTLLRRLCQKGAVLQVKQEVFYYTPLVTQNELAKYRTQQLLDGLYAGSGKALVAAMVQNDQLGREDVGELRRMFDALWRLGGK